MTSRRFWVRMFWIAGMIFNLAGCISNSDIISLTESKPTAEFTEITDHQLIETSSFPEVASYFPFSSALQADEIGKISSLIWLSDNNIVLAGSNKVGVIALPDPESYSAQQFSVQSMTPTDDTILLTRSPFEEIIGWVSNKQEINIWKPDKTKQSKVIGTSSSPITGLTIHPRGKVVAYSSTEKELNQVDILTGDLVFNQKTPTWLSNLSYSSDGTRIAGVDLVSFRVYIYFVNGEFEKQLEWSDSAISSLYGAYFSPDWSRIAWVAQTAVMIMDVKSMKELVLLSHEDPVSSIAWSLDSKLVAVGSLGTGGEVNIPKVVMWEIENPTHRIEYPQSAPVISLSFSPDGTQLAVLVQTGDVHIITY